MNKNIQDYDMIKIIASFKNNLICELNFSDFWYNLFLLSEKEEYQDILNYNFELNGDSFKFSEEFNRAVDEKYLFNENNNYFYITMNSNKLNNVIENMDITERRKYMDLVRDYIKLNMEKKQKTLK